MGYVLTMCICYGGKRMKHLDGLN